MTILVFIDVIDSLAQAYLEELNEDVLETTITKAVELKNEGRDVMHTHGHSEECCAVPLKEDLIETVAALESLPRHVGKSQPLSSMPVSTNKLLPSVVQPPSLELKPLPDHLKYVFLGDDETLPIIVSSTLTA